jgi:Cu(I)/Ag(I) efflux system membrane fusion protein
MFERNDRSRPLPASHGAPLAHGFWWKAWQVATVVQARLRFFAILAVIGLVVGYWDTLSAWYEKWSRPLYGEEGAVDPDTEYFCPMHPSVVRDNRKEKCPICHMDLAKRKKGSGEAEPLAPGTVSRVQLSPYRIVLAGVQTTSVEYRELSREVTAFGSVEFDETREAHIAARQKGRIVKLHANFTGQEVKKGEPLATLDIRYSPELTNTLDDLRRARQNGDGQAEEMAKRRLRVWDVGQEQINQFLSTGKVGTEMTVYSPIKGHVIKKYQRVGNFVDEGTPLYDVADLDSVWIEGQVYEADQGLLKEGLDARATTAGLPGRVFRGTLDFVYPHLDEASRTLAVRFRIPNPGHRLRPGTYATVKVDVPPARVGALTRTLTEDEVLVAVADTLAGRSGHLGALSLVAAGRRALLHEGKVLAVPDSAVIDTGERKVVYRQAAPDVFEGVAVELGPRMVFKGEPGAYYPVLRGLDAGDRVVTNGSFLIDAETRLNPAAGSIYYGGSAGKSGPSGVAVRPSTPQDEDALERKARSELAKLSAADRRLAEAQRFCPILQKNRLGSMGKPFKIVLEGQPVFLCCGSCEEKAKNNPKQTLETVERLKSDKGRRPESLPSTPPGPPASGPEAEIQANLNKLLPREDRALAEAQKFCPVSGERLGDPSMGVPIKVTVKDQPVFLCCKGCQGEVRRTPDKTLAKVKELKARARDEGHKHD